MRKLEHRTTIILEKGWIDVRGSSMYSRFFRLFGYKQMAALSRAVASRVRRLFIQILLLNVRSSFDSSELAKLFTEGADSEHPDRDEDKKDYRNVGRDSTDGSAGK